MKYLKYSIIILMFCIICNSTLTLAYATVPVGFTAQVSYVTKANSPKRTKTNYKLQRIHVGTTTAPSSATFSAKPYLDNVAMKTITKIGVNSTKSSLSTDLSSEPGDVYIKVWRDDAIVGTKKATGFTYDPNALVW